MKKDEAPKISKARGLHQIRTYEDEWLLIKRFMKLVRVDLKTCDLAINLLEAKQKK